MFIINKDILQTLVLYLNQVDIANLMLTCKHYGFNPVFKDCLIKTKQFLSMRLHNDIIEISKSKTYYEMTNEIINFLDINSNIELMGNKKMIYVYYLHDFFKLLKETGIALNTEINLVNTSEIYLFKPTEKVLSTVYNMYIESSIMYIPCIIKIIDNNIYKLVPLEHNFVLNPIYYLIYYFKYIWIDYFKFNELRNSYQLINGIYDININVNVNNNIVKERMLYSVLEVNITSLKNKVAYFIKGYVTYGNFGAFELNGQLFSLTKYIMSNEQDKYPLQQI